LITSARSSASFIAVCEGLAQLADAFARQAGRAEERLVDRERPEQQQSASAVGLILDEVHHQRRVRNALGLLASASL